MKDQLHSLDALRGIAALIVVLYHFTTGSPLPNITFLHTGLFDDGTLMVHLFFVLSGFVLMHVYANIFSQNIKENYKNFIVARIARIYPLHILTLFIFIILILYTKGNIDLFGRNSIWGIINNITLTQAVFVDYRTWNYPAWSISVEFFAYLIFPFFAVKIRESSNNQIYSFLFIITFLNYIIDYFHKDLIHNGVLFSGIIMFLYGVIFYEFYHRKMYEFLGHKFISLAILIITFTLPIFNIKDWWSPIIFGILILSLTYDKNYCYKILNIKSLEWLGERSYSIYMIHAITEYSTTIIFDKIQINAHQLDKMQSTIILFILLATTFILAELSYQKFEKPMRQYIKNINTKKAP